MAKKFDFSSTDTFSKVVTQFSSMDRFLEAEAEAKRQGYPCWLTIETIKAASAFMGISESTTRRAQKSGKINGLRIGGTYLYLVQDLIRAINNCATLSRLNYATYQDPGNEDIQGIHWIKYLRPDRVLIKYTLQRKTYATTLPLSYWNRNYQIGQHLIREINRHHQKETYNNTGR